MNIRESDQLTKSTVRYLTGLGYETDQIQFEVPFGHARADLVVYERNLPRIVIEIKSALKSFPNLSEEELKFHPSVRTIQRIAKTANAPYYLVSDGRKHYWFSTGATGRPQLLQNPVKASLPDVQHEERISRDVLARVFREIRDYQYRTLGPGGLNEVALALYAKLLDERDDASLKEALIQGNYRNYPIYSVVLGDIIGSRHHGQTAFFEQALHILDKISFQSVDLEDILIAIDESFLIRDARMGDIKLPRWVSSLLVRLSKPMRGEQLLDLFASYGDIIPFAAQVETHINILTAYTSRAYLIWVRIQQLLSAQPATEPIQTSFPPYELLQSYQLRTAQRVIIVPPFGGKVGGESKWYGSWLPRNATSEESYLEVALRLVSEGGRVVALIPDNLLFASNKHRIRELIGSRYCIRAIISLGKFLPQTAMRASILVIDNCSDAEQEAVFVAELPQIESEDRFDCVQISEIDYLLQDFSAFESGYQDIASVRKAISWVVPFREISLENLTPSHYIPPEISGRRVLSSPFPTVLLTDIASVRRGSGFKLDENGDVLVVGPRAIRPLDFDHSALDRTSHSELSSPRSVRAGDVVINIISTHKGAAALVPHDADNAIINRHVVLVRVETVDVIPDYLVIAINSEFVQQQFNRAATGAVIPSLNLQTIRNVVVPLPDRATQKMLVEEASKLRRQCWAARQELEAAERQLAEMVATLDVIGG